MLERVCSSDAEITHAQTLTGVVESPATLVLSAKEAFYKFTFPRRHEVLDFRDVDVHFGAGTFTARQIGADPPAGITGWFVTAPGWILCLAAQ